MTLQNEISIKSELDGYFVLIGKYISQNECLIQVLRFDEDYGWPSFEILIDNTENIEIPESNISNFTYKIQTKTMLYLLNTTTEQLIPKIIIQTHDGQNHISKYELVKLISDIYELNINVIPFKTSRNCNRILKLDILLDTDLKQQIKEMKNNYLLNI
jgi:hypothetical protein